MSVLSPRRRQVPQIRKSELSPARQRLLAMLNEVNFGRIEGLRVRSGEPVFDPPPVTTTTLKMCEDSASTSRRGDGDFTLKAHHVELLEHLARLRNGVVVRLQVRKGLPFYVSVRQENPRPEQRQ